MSFHEDQIRIAILDRRDFERARGSIAGLAQWASYDDYRSEREGRAMALAMAGLRARLSLVPLGDFLASGEPLDGPPTDAFGVAWDARPSPRAPSRSFGRQYAGGRNRGTAFDVPIDPWSYLAWLDCLGEQPSEAHFEAYRALVAERMAEQAKPKRSRSGRR